MTPWKHQAIARDRARSFDFFGLFFDVGTGKTYTVIKILEDKFKNHGRTLKTLVITPLVVVENFRREFEKFSDIPKDKIVALTGSGKEKCKRFDLMQNGNFVCITNYESLYGRDLFDRILKWRPEAVVCDELHKIKDVTAKRTKLVTVLSDIATYRYGLSGTPILNTQLDLFSQIRFLDHGRTLGKNHYIFRAQYFYDKNAARKSTGNYFPDWQPRPGIDAELKRLIAPFTMTAKKSECLDLPPMVRKEVFVEMGEDQAKAYNEMKKSFITFLRDKACTAELAITKSLRLQQIVSGYMKFEDESEVMFKDVPRLFALRNLLEDITPSHKVIVWCAFKKNYQMVQDVCNASKLPFSQLTGETVDRQKEIDAFQDDPSVRVMIANPGAGGIGVNLTAASYMIYYSKSYSLEHDLQSEARCYRGGSEIHESITRIDLISSGTIDEVILKILAEKKDIGNRVLGSHEIYARLKTGI